MKKTVLAMLAGAAVASVYAAVKGKGVFNRPRFEKQHDAVERYLDARYPQAEYSPIEQASNGWCTVVTKADGDQFVLYLTCGEDGVFVFDEEQ